MTRQPGAVAPLLTFAGATRTVTGSRFLIRTTDATVLIDAGLFQGLKALRLRNREPFPVPPSALDAVVVTHAHVDHSGYIPALVRDGFRGTVFATSGTVDLCRIVLPDSGHLQEEEAAHANRHGYSKHRPAEPLYTSDDALAALGQFRGVAFGAEIEVADGIFVTWQRAGHILGSASVRVRLAHDGDRTIVCSGDLGRQAHPLLRPPAPCPDADLVLIESTYGDRRHEPEATSLATVADAIATTAARGGAVIIPAFAVDRTEVVLWHLRRLAADGRIPRLPVFVDSPMALRTLELYRGALAAGNDADPADPGAEFRPGLTADGDPFDPGTLIAAASVDESKAINDHDGPCIIVSASGMGTGGRVVHHFARRLPDPRTTVLLVGFQAAGTRGRALADGVTTLKMLGRYVPVNAEVVTARGFSVHADADELTAWLAAAPEPEVSFVVHGESDSSESFAARIETELGRHAVVPRPGESVRLDGFS